MPMRRGKSSAKPGKMRCAHGFCRKGAHPLHYFLIDLRDGKPLIRVSACTKEHLDELRRGAKDFEVASGDQG